MSVCRTCLIILTDAPKYPIYHELEKFGRTGQLLESNKLDVRKMVEKCIPELDLDICDSPIICKKCYTLLLSAYKFRRRCTETEETIYQYIEKNNLRLGESIDLTNLSIENPYEALDLQIVESAAIKEEINDSNEFEEILNVTPVMEVENESETKQVPNTNELEKGSKKNHNINKAVDKNQTECDNHAEEEEDGCSSTSPGKNKKQLKQEKRSFICGVCHYKANKLTLLQKHKMLKCKGLTSNTLECDKCSYRTFKKSHLRRHMLVHGGERPWKCGVCKKGFTERSYLKVHMLKHIDKPLPYTCQEEGCEYSAARRCDLNMHMAKHWKKYLFCKKCAKTSYSTQEELTKHENKCTGKASRKKK